jgi:hypothetical protein
MSLAKPNQGGTGAGMPNMVGELNQFFHQCVEPEVMEVFGCNTFVNAVTTKQRLQSLLDSNRLEYVYTRISSPTVHRSTTLENTNYASPELLEGQQCKIRLGYSMYTNIKIPYQTLKMMTQSGRSALQSHQNRETARVLAEAHQADFMCFLATQVHPCNEGNSAGAVSGDIKLGTKESPIKINPRNVLSLSALLDQVLNEHQLPKSDRFMIIPTFFRTMLNLSVGRAIANTGRGFSEYVNGMCAEDYNLPCGPNVFEQNCQRPYKNAANQLVYPIYYGWKMAIDAGDKVDAENSGLFDVNNHLSARYGIQRQIINFGFSTIYCEGIARAWVTLDPDWQDKLPGGACA